MAFPKQYAPITLLATSILSSVSSGSSFGSGSINTVRGAWLISVFSNGAGGTNTNITSITDTAGNVWVKGGEFADATTTANSSVWYAPNCVGGATSITLTLGATAGNGISWFLHQVSGLYGAGPFWVGGSGSSVLNMTMQGRGLRGPAFVTSIFGCGNTWSGPGPGWYDYSLGGDVVGNGGECKVTNGPGPVVPTAIQNAAASVFTSVAMAFYGAPKPGARRLAYGFTIPAAAAFAPEEYAPPPQDYQLPPLPLILAQEELPTSFPGFVEEWGYVPPPPPAVWASSDPFTTEEWIQKLTVEEDSPPLLGWASPAGMVPFTYDEELGQQVAVNPALEEIAGPLVVLPAAPGAWLFAYDEEIANIPLRPEEWVAPYPVPGPDMSGGAYLAASWLGEEIVVAVIPPPSTIQVDAIGLGHYIGLGHV